MNQTLIWCICGNKTLPYNRDVLKAVAVNMNEEPVAGNLHGGFCEGRDSSYKEELPAYSTIRLLKNIFSFWFWRVQVSVDLIERIKLQTRHEEVYHEEFAKDGL